jgi:micrococcal nuclease
LRIIKRTRPDQQDDRLADWMQANGGARHYLGEWREGWC